MTLLHLRQSTPLHFVGFFFGILSCYFLQKYGHISSVFSASFVGLVASFLPTKKLTAHFPATLYAGAFIGMGTFLNAMNVLHLILTATIGALLYSLGMPYFNGVGGRLGFVALLSTVLFIILKSVL